jgi:hypothetical protein
MFSFFLVITHISRYLSGRDDVRRRCGRQGVTKTAQVPR